jgi:hypothetical protein
MLEHARVGERADRRRGAPAPGRGAPGLSNAGLARVLARRAPETRQALAALGVRSIARVPTRPTATARGTNPAAALELINKRDTKKVPSSVAEAKKQAETWAADVVAALNAGAKASNASHAAEIIENDKQEMAKLVELLVQDLEDDKKNPRRFKNFQEKLVVFAGLKLQEIGVEFGHDVILETDEWGKFGTDYDEEFTHLDEALKALPPGQTWGSAKAVHFKRELANKENRSVGGLTDPPTNTITLYAAGTSKDPYDRSKAIGLPGYLQTTRHEVGHLVEHGLSAAANAELFDTILEWKQHSWAWVNMPQSKDPSKARDERRALIAESGIADDKLDEWLKGFHMGDLERSNAIELNGRVFIRAGGTGHWLNSMKKSELPSGPEFEYALSNTGDYIAELYAFALSKPDWLAGKISARQLKWWRERVFSMPGDDVEVAKQLGVSETLKPAFLAAVKTKFTWEQADAVLADVTKAAATPKAATP